MLLNEKSLYQRNLQGYGSLRRKKHHRCGLGLIRPLMTEAALGNLSMIGSILIFCVGVNLVWGKKLKVANMLPAVVFAVAAAFL